MSQTWAKCLTSLKNSLPLGEFSVWVKPLQASERNEILYLKAPSASALKYINNHKSLESSIVLAVSEQDRKIKVRFGVAESKKTANSQTKHHTTPLFPVSIKVLSFSHEYKTVEWSRLPKFWPIFAKDNEVSS